MFCRPLFVPLTLIVCPSSSNYGFSLPFWYLQTFLTNTISILYYLKPLSLSVYKQHTFTSDTTHYYTSEINVKQKLNNNVSDYMYCNFFIVKTNNNNNNNNYHYFFLNGGGDFD